MRSNPPRPALGFFCALLFAAASAAADLGAIEGLMRAGRWPEAEAALRDELAARPSPRARYLLGFALNRLYRYAEAEAELRTAVAARPEEPDWHHALAQTLLERGRNREAIAVLERAIALAPRPEYRFAQAMCALNAGETALAEAALRAALEGDPENPEALFHLARIEVDRGAYAAALPLARRALAARPEHLEARYLLGLGEARAGDPEAAAAAFAAVLERVPGHVGALYNLGRTFAVLGRPEESRRILERFRAASALSDEIDYLERAVQKNPRNVEGRTQLADKLLAAGRGGEALAQLLAARELDPRRAATYRGLAEALRRLGRPEDAARAEDAARRLESGGR